MYKYNEPEIKINEFVAEKMLETAVANLQSNPVRYASRGKLSYKNFLSALEQELSVDQPYFEASWSLGGTWCDYTGRTGRVSAEAPVELVALDDFLMKHYPQTSFMQYKTISNKIENLTDSEGDYYGGSVDKAIKRITYENLSDALVQVGLEKPGQVLNKKQLEEFITNQYSAEWFQENFSDNEPQVKPAKKSYK